MVDKCTAFWAIRVMMENKTEEEEDRGCRAARQGVGPALYMGCPGKASSKMPFDQRVQRRKSPLI